MTPSQLVFSLSRPTESKNALLTKVMIRVHKEETQMTKKHIRNIFILISNQRNSDKNDILLFFSLSNCQLNCMVKGSEGAVSKTASGSVHWAQFFWKVFWQHISKNLKLSFNSVIPLLGIYLKGENIEIYRKICD